jgi:hypothetical protein
MLTLLKEELARARRLDVFRFVAVAGVAGIVVGCVFFGVTSHRPTDADWSSARALQEKWQQDCLSDMARKDTQQPVCDPGDLASYLSPDIRVFDERSIPRTIVWSALLLGLAGWLSGAVMVGADWASGMLMLLLTWEPRRGRVLSARLIVAGVIAFILSAALLVALVVGLVVVATTRGLTSLPPGFWMSVVAAVLRVATITSIATVASGAVAFITRSATFAVAALFVYLVAVEASMSLHFPSVARWLVAQNVVTWTTGHRPVDLAPTHTYELGALGVLFLWTLVTVIVAAWTFHARDVTA